MGPFQLMDLIGIDINAGAMRSMYEQTFGEPRYQPHRIQMQKVAEGALGRKSGRGFYEYTKDAKEEKGKSREKKEKAAGRILVSEGSWAPGLADLCSQAGYQVDSVPDPGQPHAACFVVAGRGEEAERLAAWYDQSLPPEVPLFVQCADIALSEVASPLVHPERLIGLDGLFFAQADIATLTAATRVSADLRQRAEMVLDSLGKQVEWVQETPALVLPRIICQLANEAAFAELEGVADGATIDLAMRLGVNYPKGPLEWGEAVGWEKVLGVIDYLFAEYHEERYRACLLLRRWARGFA